MAALQCEICGGKLVGKPGGIFECDSCGMEYSTEWAKAKIQEIKGTVKVEGTVEVTGKVQVEGGSVTVEGAATKESLLKRAKMCCAEKQWKKAGELLEQVLNADPECGEAYLYSYMSKNQMRTQDELHSAYVNVKWKVNESRDIEKALCFAAGETAEMLAQWEQDRQAAIEEDRKHRQKMRGVLEARRKLIEPAKKRIVMGEGYIAGLRIDGTVALTGEREGRFNVGSWCDIVAIAGDYDHIVGLRVDGTVVATGDNKDGQCNVSKWRDIVEIACTGKATIGLQTNGRVITTGWSQRDVESWENVTAIVCGDNYSIGLHADGTVVATGDNENGQCNVGDWRNITAIACCNSRTVGLCTDGTAVATGWNNYGECNVKGWRDIIAIACGDSHTVGLCADGTVVATECDDDSRCSVGDWRCNMTITKWADEDECSLGKWWDIIAIDCGYYHTVGLRLDGTVVATGRNMYGQCDVSNCRWENIVVVACSDRQTVGLCADGTVITTGDKTKNKCDTSKWKLFDSIDTLAEELEESRKAAKAHRLAEQRAEDERRLAQQEAARAEKERELAARRARRAELEQERDALKTELASLKGIFAGIRRRDIETRLEQIETGLESYKED